MANFFSDPLMAGFLWEFSLLIFAWIMVYELRDEKAPHTWWENILIAGRVVPKGQGHYPVAVDKSRTWFRRIGILMPFVLIIHFFIYYKRLNPYFLYGPKPVTVTNPNAPLPVPDARAGAGGGGVFQPRTPPQGGSGAAPGANSSAQPNAGGSPTQAGNTYPMAPVDGGNTAGGGMQPSNTSGGTPVGNTPVGSPPVGGAPAGSSPAGGPPPGGPQSGSSSGGFVGGPQSGSSSGVGAPPMPMPPPPQ